MSQSIRGAAGASDTGNGLYSAPRSCDETNCPFETLSRDDFWRHHLAHETQRDHVQGFYAGQSDEFIARSRDSLPPQRTQPTSEEDR